MSTIIDWYRRTINPRDDLAEMLAAVREIRSTVKIQNVRLGRMEETMATVDDAVKLLTPKLAANHEELLLVLKTVADNQAAAAAAIQDALDKGASPETLAAIQAANDQAGEDLQRMQTALNTTPPAGTGTTADTTTTPPVFAAPTSTTEG